jgi:hypothetical protein
MIPCPPKDYSLRELETMSEAGQETAWRHTSGLMSAIAATCGVKINPDDLNPHIRQETTPSIPRKPSKETLQSMAGVRRKKK